MAFDINDLSALTYANGHTVWHYKSTDALATIMADAYFDTASHMLRANDKITIEASDGIWEDVIESVVTTVGSEDVAIGVQANTVVDSTGTNTHRLGLRRKRWDGAEFVRLVADEAIGQADVVQIEADDGALLVTATTAADSTGMGKDLAVSPAVPSQAIATGDWFWGCIKAPATAGVKFTAVASVEAFSQLYPSATGGALTDVANAGVTIAGIVSTEEDDIEPVGVINYPRVYADLII